MALELKILFLTDDQDFLSVLENVESDADVIVADDATEMLQMLETLKKKKDELCLIFLDFDTHQDDSESVCKKYGSVNHLKTIIFTGEVPLSELKKHQRSGKGAHAYLRKPLSVDQLQDIIHTTQVAHELENGREEPTDEDLCIFKLSDDALFDQAPSDSSEDDSSSFSASELKMDTEVRKTLSNHGDFVFDQDDEVNQKVQKLFDMAFDGSFEKDIKANKTALNNLNPVDGFELPDDDSSDEEVSKFEDDESADESIAFDLGGEDEGSTEDILDQMEHEREASLVNFRPPTDDDTGEILLSEEDRDEIRAEDSMSVKDDDSDSSLNFSLPQDEEEETVTDGGLEFSVGDEEESNDLTSTTDDISFGVEEEDGVSPVMDEDMAGLELSDEESDDLAFGTEENDEDVATYESDDEGGLELGSSDEEFGDLDLGSDDDDAEPTVIMSSKQRMEELPSADLDMDEDSTLDLNSAEFDDDPIFDESIPDPSIKSGNTGSLEGTIKSIVAHRVEDDIGELTGDYSLPEGTDLTSSEEIGLSELMSDDNETASFEEAATEEDETVFDTMQVSAEEDDSFSESTDPTRIFAAAKEEDDIEQALYAQKTLEETKPRGSRVAKAPVAETLQPYNEEDSIRSQGLLRAMREEREDLLKQVNELKANMKILESENLGLKAEKEELKIEIAIIKKRNQNEVEELNYRLKIAEEKRDIYKEKVKTVQTEFDRNNQRIRIDHSQIKQREKELEGQLELVRADSQSQVESRDKKILELKRKIDALEFNMENTVIREQKTREDKLKLEERLSRMMKTLRGSIQVLENDLLEDDVAVGNDDEGKEQHFKK